jgi:hypothetical protein
MLKNNNLVLIGVDFSINKPGVCIFKNNIYEFISFPFELSKSQINIYKDSPLNLIERTDKKYKGKNSSEKMRFDVSNSKYLAQLIFDNVLNYLENSKKIDYNNVYLGFEGFSFASKGNIMLQLSGYKFILMDVFSKIIPYERMFTYAPITIKSIAECAQKGMGKKEMIDAFLKTNINCNFKNYLNNNQNLFKTKSGKWIIHLDDLVDSFFVIQTMLKKENF